MREADAGVLARLQQDIEACRICVDAPLKTPLPHAPRPVVRLSSTARICVAGQAPGNRVNLSGVPFDDASGERLRDWMGLDRARFYDVASLAIVPMGFCFPGTDTKGGDRPPRKECAQRWRDSVFASMPQIELVLAIGGYAQAWHLGRERKATLTETVENWRQYLFRNEGRRVLPLPHPSWRNTAWLKRNPWFEREVVPELRTLVAQYCA
ncbi:MAG: uracil-DNA glycosylase family protein [Pseudomonadota bacterium]